MPFRLALSRSAAYRTAAALGWGYALAAWAVLGHGAGVDPGFILASCVGITATLAAEVVRILPQSQAVYALGYREGREADEAGTVEPPPLALVR